MGGDDLERWTENSYGELWTAYKKLRVIKEEHDQISFRLVVLAAAWKRDLKEEG